MDERQNEKYRQTERNPFLSSKMGRDSPFGVAACYILDGQGIESRVGATLSGPVQTGPGIHSASYTVGTGSLPRW